MSGLKVEDEKESKPLI